MVIERITSRKNLVALHVKKLGANRAYREECGEFLCDGIKLLEDAVRSGAEIKTVLTASHIPFPLPLETRVYYTERSLIDSISPLKNAQNTLFTCGFPSTYMHRYSDFQISNSLPVRQEGESTHAFRVLLDGMQDPGNVGTIIRTANAFGVNCVFFTDGCADPFNPKTIRASMGSVFRQRMCNIGIPELTALRDSGVRIIGAAMGEGSSDVLDMPMGGSIIAIGSEGSGLSDEVLLLCDERIMIPISPECESLNAAAAAAIIIWEAHRHALKVANSGLE